MDDEKSAPVAGSSAPAERDGDNVVPFTPRAGRARPAPAHVSREAAVDLLLRDILGPLYRP